MPRIKFLLASSLLGFALCARPASAPRLTTPRAGLKYRVRNMGFSVSGRLPA